MFHSPVMILHSRCLPDAACWDHKRQSVLPHIAGVVASQKGQWSKPATAFWHASTEVTDVRTDRTMFTGMLCYEICGRRTCIVCISRRYRAHHSKRICLKKLTQTSERAREISRCAAESFRVLAIRIILHAYICTHACIACIHTQLIEFALLRF